MNGMAGLPAENLIQGAGQRRRDWRGMGVFWFLVEINPIICLEVDDEKAAFCRHHQTLRTSWELASVLMEYTARPVWLLGGVLFTTLVYSSLSLK